MTKKALALIFIAGIALLATACPERRTIADIERNPGKYNGKDVTIVGTVRSSYGISLPGTRMGGGIYEVNDGTGSIWVIAERGVPSKGTEIVVSGTYGNAITWNGRNYGTGLREKHRHFGRR